jgi:hypothetical protein
MDRGDRGALRSDTNTYGESKEAAPTLAELGRNLAEQQRVYDIALNLRVGACRNAVHSGQGLYQKLAAIHNDGVLTQQST